MGSPEGVGPKALGSLCETPAALGPLGLHTTARELQTRTLRHCCRGHDLLVGGPDDLPVEAATAPLQCALSTRAVNECIAHTLQGLTELNPRATVVSIDGVSACDKSPGQRCSQDFSTWRGVARLCHSFGCSVAHPLQTHGKIRVVFFTQSGRGKAENREMRSCPCCSLWGNTGLWWQFSQSCKMENSCSCIWTTFTRWSLLTEWVRFNATTFVGALSNPSAHWQDVGVEQGRREVDGAADVLGADSRGAGFAVSVVIAGSQRFGESKLSLAGC